ncbi:MAG: MBOAT family protein [Chloroflexi bacterium]|nr:MBOAT family protein [Chloroflexota bacterium]
MLFNSFQFALFFPIVTILYFLLPHKHRWWLLLGASAYFYMAFVPSYILILGTTIIVDYFAGIWIEEAKTSRRKKLYLLMSLVANIGFLAFFKYFNFVNTNIVALAGMIGWNYSMENLKIILPIGLSFHTFQAMSYTIEVFRGNQQTERHFGIYALYVLFYPQLVAGPIERPQNMLRQFHEEHFFDYQRVANGLKLMTWGLYKKVVVADRLAPLVNRYYSNPQAFSGPQLALATAFFAMQIFCDFSGYSDIAIGAAQVMGFNLMVNFKRPYLSLSFSEFWKRWHISLSSWFRDYLYIPLGGNRVPPWRWQLNLAIVFLVSGLWHGAGWTFVVWGALHGLYIILEIKLQNLQNVLLHKTRIKLPIWGTNFLRRLVVFVFVCYAWIFFRAPSIQSAFFIAAKVFTGWSDKPELMKLVRTIFTDYELMVTLFAIAIMEVVHYFQERKSILAILADKSPIIRWSLYAGILICILVFGKIYSIPTDFIYFQF